MLLFVKLLGLYLSIYDFSANYTTLLTCWWSYFMFMRKSITNAACSGSAVACNCKCSRYFTAYVAFRKHETFFRFRFFLFFLSFTFFFLFFISGAIWKSKCKQRCRANSEFIFLRFHWSVRVLYPPTCTLHSQMAAQIEIELSGMSDHRVNHGSRWHILIGFTREESSVMSFLHNHESNPRVVTWKYRRTAPLDGLKFILKNFLELCFTDSISEEDDSCGGDRRVLHRNL